MMISVALYVDDSPSWKPPPYIHTMTGSADDVFVPVGRKMLRVRQSSEEPVACTAEK